MARPQNDGLAYFPFDVDFFSDRKIKVIRGSDIGSDGLIIYLYLLCEIYREGYYIICDDDLICCASADTGVPEGKTRQIIKLLVSKSLFDNTRFTADKVLTATSIQRRYQEAKKTAKREVAVKSSVWLLDESETLGFVKVYPCQSYSEKNPSYSEKNPSYSEINYTKESKVKESKVNESRVKQVACATLTDAQRQILIDEFGTASVTAYINKMERWRVKTNAKITNEFETLVQWLKKDCSENKADEHSSFNVDELERKTIEEYKEKCE